MSSSLSVIISKRSLSLGKTYIAISVFLLILGIFISNIENSLTGLNTSSIQTGSNESALTGSLPLISIPIMVFAVLTFTTPVILLYVYDKNNGVLEYFLSLGMNQGDVYKSYVLAAEFLAAMMVTFEIGVNGVAGVLLGASHLILLEESLLVPVIGLPVVALVTIIMWAFGSLQKQRIGSNQPLGVGLGVLFVLPTYIIPFVMPSLAILADLVIASIIVLSSLVVFFLASRLISREKLLP